MVRKIKSKLILELGSQGQSGHAIAAAHGMSRNSIAQVFEAADREGLSCDDIAEMPEAEVYVRLFPGHGEHTSVYVQPDWTRVHRELGRVGVTLKLLHSEYVDLVKTSVVWR